jgi:hypothetical protein
MPTHQSRPLQDIGPIGTLSLRAVAIWLTMVLSEQVTPVISSLPLIVTDAYTPGLRLFKKVPQLLHASVDAGNPVVKDSE